MSDVLRAPLTWMALFYLTLLIALPHAEPLFRLLLPDQPNPLYLRRSFLELTLFHLLLVGGAAFVSVLLGVGVAVLVTSRPFAEFRPLAESIASVGQIVPPVAVLAIAVPLIGFGGWPTLIALILYGLLPVLQSAIAGLSNVPVAVLDAARAMGFSPRQVLIRVKMPLALPAIMSGIRVAVTISIGTATVGSIVGATSLGDPIISGLVNGNNAYVLQGCVAVAGLAVLVDAALKSVERLLSRA